MSTDPETLRPVAHPTTFPLLAELLAEQPRLRTPVARFAASHEHGEAPPSARYRDLLPMTSPQNGQQYAFEVDLDRCTGCKSCVAGCHSLNGLDDGETWRDVGLLVNDAGDQPFQQTLTTACHHCAEPGCLEGCPVLAYEKDETTGIVRHLDDQCIGCQYCILKCPYDVPKYNARLGIVRKCDLCQQRLAVGEAPACAQACPTQAIRIVVVEAGRASDSFPDAAPAPDYTRPTTRYVSKNPIPSQVRAADHASLRPQPAHWPLVAMLVGTQSGLGLLTGAALGDPGPGRSAAAGVGLLLFGAGLLASVLHLGQPTRAWRVFLNLRASWLSREAVLFGLLPLPLALAAAEPVLGWTPPMASLWQPLSLALAVAAVAASSMIYVDTRRAAWRASATSPRFFGTALVAALVPLAPWSAAVVLAAKVFAEHLSVRLGRTEPSGEKTARLHRETFARVQILRWVTAAAAAVAWITGHALLGLLPYLAGELAERYLYFRTVVAPKMPGVPQA